VTDTLRPLEFSDVSMIVGVIPTKKDADLLPIDEVGRLLLPAGFKPSGFHLEIYLPEETPVVLLQKDTSIRNGKYHSDSFLEPEVILNGGGRYLSFFLADPIIVERRGVNVWTPWKHRSPNRVDFWEVRGGGEVALFQVGIVTHDNGETFRLVGEERWGGRLFTRGEKLVARPDEPRWGSFDPRRPVLENDAFRFLLARAQLSAWSGQDSELDPAVDLVPRGGLARVLWWNTFMGQSGMALARMRNGKEAWIHGSDVATPARDKDGVKRLRWNELVAYSGAPLVEGGRTLLKGVEVATE